eukprot:s1399_g21.t1
MMWSGLDCEWGAWSDWGDCSRCGGQRFRHRAIMKMPNECARSVRLQQPLRNDQVLCMVVMDQYKLL